MKVLELLLLTWLAISAGSIAFQLRRIAVVNEEYTRSPLQVVVEKTTHGLVAIADDVDEYISAMGRGEKMSSKVTALQVRIKQTRKLAAELEAEKAL